MSDDVKDGLRRMLEEDLRKQTAHGGWAPLRVIWEAGYDITQVLVEAQPGVREWMSPKRVVEMMAVREGRIKRSEEEPLYFAWECEMWRRIDLAMARKRLAHPGKVIELLATGGIRSGKTEGCTRRGMANFLYTPDSWVWGLHETEVTSRTIQQARVERFLPKALNPSSGKMKKDKNTKFTYTAGTGFTGQMFIVDWECQDETGRKFKGGGEWDFRFYGQAENTFHGSELTCALSDELLPMWLAKTVRERLSTRAADTARPEFLARIEQAVKMLERGEELPVPLLGAIYHSVHLISFTPKEGWSPTVNHFLTNAEKREWEESPDLALLEGVTSTRVPRFAQPVEPTKLVAYLFTSDNRVKPAYEAVREGLRTEAEVRVTLHGDVDKDWQSRFSGFDVARHRCGWRHAPSDGTVTEVIDPASAKPWVINHFIVDGAGRHQQLQEWPCPKIEVEGRLPGMWAVVSEGENRNGDAGPAQKLRLHFTRSHWTWLIWSQRMRLAQKLRAVHGDRLRVRVEKKKLTWKSGLPELEGEFVIPEMTLMDSRFAQVRVESGGASYTLLEAMMAEENGVPMLPAPGDPIHEGDEFIAQELAAVRIEEPGLRVNEECENTLFTLGTYTVPEHRDTTRKQDEACKDFRDPLAYYLLSGPEHVLASQRVSYVVRK